MSDWNELVACAVLGTSRRQPPTSGLPGFVPPNDDARLLAAAAAGAAVRRAAALPARAGSPPDGLPEEAGLRVCGPRAALRLRSFLAGDEPDVLPEFLRLLTAAGLQAPPELLPSLLDAGRQNADLRADLAPVVGRRGQWLARSNGGWGYLLGLEEPESEETWETGARPARAAYLLGLRRRDPAAARELLRGVWSQEDAQNRAAFLQVFAVGLSPEDEGFLEEALGDKGRTVRKIAAELLARLPASEFARRMAARADPLVHFRETAGTLGFGKKLKIELDLPAACDAAMVRDGIEAKRPPTVTRMGDRAWWLYQMLAAIPPGHWSERSGLSATQLLQAESEERPLLEAAWTEAACRFKDAGWAEALLRGRKSHRDAVGALVDLLPPEKREELALGAVREAKQFGGSAPAVEFVDACRHPWSSDLTRLVVAVLKVRAAGRGEWEMVQRLRQYALFADPGCLEVAAADWPDRGRHWNEWEPAVRRFLGTLRLRRGLAEEARG